MEYDTSKTYSENKELINEGVPKAWITAISNFAKKRWGKIGRTKNELKEQFIENWTEHFSTPESVAKSLKDYKLNDLSSKIDDKLNEIKNIEDEIKKFITIIANPGGSANNSIIEAKQNLKILVKALLEKNQPLLVNYHYGLKKLHQINTQGRVTINIQSYLDKLEIIITKYKNSGFNITTDTQLYEIKQEIKNIYKNFNSDVINNTTIYDQKWSLYATIATIFNYIADITMLTYVVNTLIKIDNPLIRDSDRLKPLVKTYCSSYGNSCANSSSTFCRYSNMVGENLRENQLILLYTLIYGVLTKKSILKNTTSEEFCSLLIKYKISTIDFSVFNEFIKKEQKLKNYILRSLYEYNRSNKNLFKLFMNVWVKNKQIIIDSSVTSNLYENAKNFIMSNFTVKESKLIETNFEHALNEQQVNPIKQQVNPNQPQQSSMMAAGLAGITTIISKYGNKAWSFLKKIFEKKFGKLYTVMGIIIFLIEHTNIPKNVWNFIVDTLNATERTAFIDFFNTKCGSLGRGELTNKRNQTDASLNFYIKIFNDRTFWETYFTDLNKNTINMALWAIFGDYVRGTNSYAMGDLCYINDKTNGEFVKEFQKFYNNLPNMDIQQIRTLTSQNVNTFNRALDRFHQSTLDNKAIKIFQVIFGDFTKNADGTYKSQFRNEFASMKKINHVEMIEHYLKSNIKTSTNNLGGETWG